MAFKAWSRDDLAGWCAYEDALIVPVFGEQLCGIDGVSCTSGDAAPDVYLQGVKGDGCNFIS
jgi:ketosteroid isomerase-like protein